MQGLSVGTIVSNMDRLACLLTVIVQLLPSVVSDLPSQPAPASCYLTTACSVSCGEGFRLLLPNKGQVTCMPGVLQVLPCMERVCPGECRWGQWSEWSGCSQSCTQGRERGRERSASHGGEECRGELYEKRDCWSTACQGRVTFSIL